MKLYIVVEEYHSWDENHHHYYIHGVFSSLELASTYKASRDAWLTGR